MNSLKSLAKTTISFLVTSKQLVFLIILVIVGIVSSVLVRQEERRVEGLWQERRQIEAEAQRLVELSKEYPDYRDLLYRLAVLEWELGNEEEARETLQEARRLDPNNPVLKQVEESIKK